MDRDLDHEAIQSLDQFVLEGHQIGDGLVCQATCPVCAIWPSNPEIEYSEIIAMFAKYPKGGTFTVRRQVLHALSLHPDVKHRRSKTVPVIVEVYVTQGDVCITLRSHFPIQGSREPHTKGFPMLWTERSGEGVLEQKQKKT